MTSSKILFLAAPILLVACGESVGGGDDANEGTKPTMTVEFPDGTRFDGLPATLDVEFDARGRSATAMFRLTAGYRWQGDSVGWVLGLGLNLEDILDDHRASGNLGPASGWIRLEVIRGTDADPEIYEVAAARSGSATIRIESGRGVGAVEANPAELSAEFDGEVEIRCAVSSGTAGDAGTVEGETYHDHLFETQQCAPLKGLARPSGT